MTPVYRFLAVLTILVEGFSISLAAGAQEKNQISYTVKPKALISIANGYGAVTVKPSGSRQVIVDYRSGSKSVTFENERHGNRIALRCDSAKAGTNLAEYSIQVPSDSVLILFAAGAVHVEGLVGDMTLETWNSPIVLNDIHNAHVHARTMDGSITLSEFHDSHVYIHSIKGTINISNVTDSWIEAHSDSGEIAYEGNPGGAGEYKLTTHSGDVEVSIPVTAVATIKTSSLLGQSDEELQTAEPSSTSQRNFFLKNAGTGVPRFVLRSFSGKVRLKRPRLR